MRFTRATSIILLVLGTGCSLVADLGDPKDFAPSGLDGDGGPSASVQAVAIAVGASHACAIIQASEGSPENGTTRCWGDNTHGELGVDPSLTPSSPVPVPVSSRSSAVFGNAAALALGTGGSCALTTDNFLFCWGELSGQGSGTVHRQDLEPSWEPSQMDLRDSVLVGVTGVALGEQGGCAADANALVCWGSGPGATNIDGGAVQITDVTSVAVGRSHACAITTEDGAPEARCWGDNTYGQTGQPESSSFESRPQPVALAGVVEIAAGGDVSCARTTSSPSSPGTDAVYCWGRNDRGELGDPAVTAASTNAPTEVRFAGGLTAVALAIGDSHACALMSDETVQCWGDDSDRQLGRSAPAGYDATPATVERDVGGEVNDMPHVKSLEAGGGTTCAIRWGDPQVYCWGRNDAGQAGQAAGVTVPYASAVSW